MSKRINVPLIVIFVFASLLLSTLISLGSVNSLIKKNRETFVAEYTGRIYSSVNESLEEPEVMSKAMANSFVKNILAGRTNLSEEETESAFSEYLTSLAKNNSYDRLFIVNCSNMNYYTTKGLQTKLDPQNQPEDAWYPDIISSDETIVFRLDNINKKIYVNLKIFDDDGTLLGLCGTASTIESLMQDLEDFSKDGYFSLRVVSADGDCKLSMNIDECGKKVHESTTNLLNQYTPETSHLYAGDKNNFTFIKQLHSSKWFLVIENGPNRFDLYKKLLLWNILISSIIMAIVLLVLNFILSKIRKNQNRLIDAEEEQGKIIKSLGDIYHTMHLFDLKNNICTEFSTIDQIHEIYEKKDTTDIQILLHEAIEKTCSPKHLKGMLEFTNFSTLSSRMQNKKYISQEFDGNINGWVRGSFIKVSNEEDKYLFVTSLIENDKKREEQLIKISKTDELTRLFNRRAYEEDLPKTKDQISENLIIISIDVNGLKKANDTLGHAAGDELIIGAAQTLTAAFDGLGQVYRTGGDEFMALLTCSKTEVESAVAKLDSISEQWSGKLVKKLAIAKGVAICSDYPDKSIHEIEAIADELMYKDKNEYYERTGIDRRVGK